MATKPTELESYFLERVNETRAAAGVPPVTFDGELMNAADAHSAWMDANDTQSHIGANDSTPRIRVTEAGYRPLNVGEIVLIDQEGGLVAEESPFWVDHSHAKYVASPGHRETMTNPIYQHVGISFQEGDRNGEPAAISTLVFGNPTAAEAAENNMPPLRTLPDPTSPFTPVDPGDDPFGTPTVEEPTETDLPPLRTLPEPDSPFTPVDPSGPRVINPFPLTLAGEPEEPTDPLVSEGEGFPFETVDYGVVGTPFPTPEIG
jgi:hypothetical protein